LPIIDLFRNQSEYIHTGSDGQKFDVSIASLRASASFKYFGDGKGITIYSHLDEAGQLIYSTVFSAGEREAPYVLDALSHDEIITSDALYRYSRLY
jgi:TnpA family transposase